jgi:hypothetical protein
VFVFGSGHSLNEITPAEWAEIARHDVISLNYFLRQAWVRVDVHLVGEISTLDDLDASRWRPAVREYAELLRANPLYRDAAIGLQAGWHAYQSNRLRAMRLLPADRPFFYYRRIARGQQRPPTRRLAEGLVHGPGSIVNCINLGYVLGWREIVLAGVDLYDSRYFWLPKDEDRRSQLELGRRLDQPHPVAQALVPYLAAWSRWLAAEGVRLSVYNPRSLLAQVLPLHAAAAR